MKLVIEMKLLEEDGTVNRSRGSSWDELSDKTGKYIHDHIAHFLRSADDVITRMEEKEPHTCHDWMQKECAACEEKA
jgi:hypothetical protein